jgi:prepilin-type N-terminal cleavage/methylation domain-containing protein
MSCKLNSTPEKCSYSTADNSFLSHIAKHHIKPAGYSMQAFTLLEFIITLAIGSILLSTAIPNFHSYTQRSHANSIIANLQQTIYAARQLAITQNKIITLCPVGDQRCGVSWEAGYMLFTDGSN